MMDGFLKKTFDLFLFSSLFIALCAVVMTLQTNQLLKLDYNADRYLAFVFCSTICSYNFHWYLTPDSFMEHNRALWTRQHKVLHLVLFFAGLISAAWLFFSFIQYWFWMAVPVVLTFLYSAPKVPYAPFSWLKKVAIGKTLFLALVWLYVTTLTPIILGGHDWQPAYVFFACSRFFLVYAICIVFDYRDRENDRRDGIRSMITFFSERGINVLFYGSLITFLIATVGLYFCGYSLLTIIAILIPGFIVLSLYRKAKTNFSDYLFYFVLDGLMMLSSLFTLLVPH
jgi:4-hydroxybenzoate polyprenyltransferase